MKKLKKFIIIYQYIKYNNVFQRPYLSFYISNSSLNYRSGEIENNYLYREF